MAQHKPEFRITHDPGILGGKPIIRGTRISVELIKDWIASGVSEDQIVEDYPNLTVDDIQAAIAFNSCQEGRIEVRPWRAVG